MKITHYKLSLLFTRCTVLMPLPHSFATSRMEYPLRSKLITSLYSSFICSVVFTEPTLRPSFPPFSIYRLLPDCNRNEILSRSNCAQVESVDVIIRTKRDGFPSFYNCKSLTNINISNGVMSIGDNAFEGCVSLKSIKIPDSVTSIGDYAFGECDSLSPQVKSDIIQRFGENVF